jgi:hypothetical protein
MTELERVLSADMARLLDRLSASMPEGALDRIRTATPTLRARLDETEASLATIRASLVDGYARWTSALDDLENLWALAAWRAVADEPTQKPSQAATRRSPRRPVVRAG